MPVPLTPAELRRDLAVRDLTDPGAGSHAIQRLIGDAVVALRSAWPSEVRWCRGERIVTVEDNYDRLGFDPAAVTRDARYTRYVDDRRMLRSHSSAMIPPALRALGGEVADVLLVCPGIVFRRDAIDRLHTGTPHQLDLWRITGRAMTDADMDEMISRLLDALAPGQIWRSQARVHPYTRNGRQVDVRQGAEWVEVLECGLAHPEVLGRAGLAPGTGGLALGLGLDRLLMLAKGIPDIRALRSRDPRIAAQMDDLSAYRGVSAMPPIRRDLSIAVGLDQDVEALGDRVRDALGSDATAVEEVAVLSATPCSALSARACQRLGARPEQTNLLVRVVLRDLDRTLSDDDANEMRDRIYATLHRGSTFSWAARPRGQADEPAHRAGP